MFLFTAYRSVPLDNKIPMSSFPTTVLPEISGSSPAALMPMSFDCAVNPEALFPVPSRWTAIEKSVKAIEGAYSGAAMHKAA